MSEKNEIASRYQEARHLLIPNWLKWAAWNHRANC